MIYRLYPVLNVRRGLPHTAVKGVIVLSQANIYRLDPSERVMSHTFKY